MESSSSTHRIARNTLILYLRTGLSLIIGVWSTRIILEALGFVDNGIYNVVGGFVGFFSLVTSSQSSAISRFMTYEIGKGDKEKINLVFQNSLCIQLILAIVVLVLTETIGIWFVNNRLVFPHNRVVEVNIIYQLSIFTFILGLLSISQNALIISYERMNVFAYVSICTTISRLIISFIILYSPNYRLIIYAVLLFIIGLATRIFYAIYSKREFPFCKYKIKYEKQLLKKMFGFAGWNFIGNTAAIFRNSGTSILLNIFGGPVANTINGISSQFNNLVSIFVGDFTTAYGPQITKRYASGDYPSFIRFMYLCIKFSFLLMTLMAVPVFFGAKFILDIWLKDVPENTTIFIQLTIIFALTECISRPLITAKLANGEIKVYQIVVGGILLFTIPISYVFLKIGLPIYYTYVSIVITASIAFFVRLYMLKGVVPGWSSLDFIYKVVFPMAVIFLLSSSLPFICKNLLNIEDWRLLIISFFWAFFIIGVLGINKNERAFIKQEFKRIIRK